MPVVDISLSLYPPVSPYTPFYASIYLSIYLYFYLTIYLYLSVCTSICPIYLDPFLSCFTDFDLVPFMRLIDVWWKSRLKDKSISLSIHPSIYRTTSIYQSIWKSGEKDKFIISKYGRMEREVPCINHNTSFQNVYKHLARALILK